MENIDREELLSELSTLRKENAALKAMYKKEISGRKLTESGFDFSSVKTPPLFSTESDDMKLHDEQNIRQLFGDYIRMYSSRDDKLTEHFSENFSGFTGGGDFLVKDKNEWVAITRQDFAQVKDPIRIELKDLAVQSLADTIAVATGFFTIHLPIKDHVLSRETARLVLIFRKESADWKISHSSISIPYYLVREGEVYPLQELIERNQILEELVSERTIQLSLANDDLQKINEKLEIEIEEHNLAVNALKQSNQKLEAIISATPDGIGMISLDGKMQFVSDKLAKMNNYSVEEKDKFLGKSVFDFIDPSNHKMLMDNIRKLIDGKSDNKLTEYLAIKKDNIKFYIDVNSTVLRDLNNNPESILFVERDITERKIAEEALQQSNQKLEAIIAASPDGIGMISLDGKMQLMSDKLAEMYGYSKEQKNEIIGKSAFDFIDSSNHKILTDNIRKLIAGEKENKLSEYIAIKKDNSRFNIDVNSAVLFDSEGNPASVLFVERDITERKRDELIIHQQTKQLQELNATKDKFFSIIAHDLRSPFQGFISLTEIMEQDIKTFTLDELSVLSKKINSTAGNLFKLLVNLLEWAQMQEGTMKFSPKDYILSEIVKEGISAINQVASEKMILIVNAIPDSINVNVDEKMISSVFRNLLSNAIKYTTRGGKIIVNAKETGHEIVEISVNDNGIGMPEDLCKKLFKMEEVVGRKGTEGEDSSGLGLLLCKEFVERNGGKIWAESEVGKGSTFYFTINKFGNEIRK